ncbi:hypothetical protein [Methylobacterium sp. Leaf399]|uniref:hypothetical protein n=1 Tax=Methylobacterium sp. Leaf399 TaxID=1736364 RepID=UPI0026D77CCC
MPYTPMPDTPLPNFVAVLISVLAFTLGVVVLNGLTRLAMAAGMAPADLAENGFLQYGGALLAAHAIRRLTARRGLARSKS